MMQDNALVIQSARTEAERIANRLRMIISRERRNKNADGMQLNRCRLALSGVIEAQKEMTKFLQEYN